MPTGPIQPSIAIDVVAFLLGLAAGSFLNVLALRSLSEQSLIWPPSHCPQCKHRLSLLDNIPLVSYAILKGRCRYCKVPIHWQYPVVELFTAVVFVLLSRLFLTNPIPYAADAPGSLWDRIAAGLAGRGDLIEPIPAEIQIGLTIGLGLLACTLIAVTITDFREKLIPHEITYPSMMVGIVFSIWRGDLPAAMAGIGASYILFDFIAFYGLKFYLAVRGAGAEEVRKPALKLSMVPPESARRIAEYFRSRLSLTAKRHGRHQSRKEEEPLEVMGGGDAVLSAVMAAYLGWQLLVVALVLGFLAGTIMGLALLLIEMKKAGILHKCTQRIVAWGALGALILAVLSGGFFSLLGTAEVETLLRIALQMGLVGFGCGAVLAVTSVGTGVSRPFPFGPALALGGFIAMFSIPHWVAFH